LSADRDPQLAILYTLVVVTLVFLDGGKYSLDAKLSSKRAITMNRHFTKPKMIEAHLQSKD
jgi:hypothetical protein